MAKYYWQNNHNRSSAGELALIVLFGFVSLAFLVLPLFRGSIQNVWHWVTLSRALVDVSGVQTYSGSECVVLATPPMEAFDTVLLECNPDREYTSKNFVWYKTAGKRYLVGWVTAMRRDYVVARLFSTGNTNQPVEIKFDRKGEKYSAIPVGNGTFRVEVPVDIAIVDGSDVYHAVSGQLLGVVSGVRVEKGSYVKRVYIRLPFSFEMVERLSVE